MDASIISSRAPVFKTKWFELIEKTFENGSAPHYSIGTRDYVTVLAVTPNETFPLVRQFRPAVETTTLELPGGHVDEGETPTQAAKRELLEETGFVATKLIPLHDLSPDVGRLGNRMWSFFAPGVTRDAAEKFSPHPEVEFIEYNKSLCDLILNEPAFCSALNRATILMAIAAGHIAL